MARRRQEKKKWNTWFALPTRITDYGVITTFTPQTYLYAPGSVGIYAHKSGAYAFTHRSRMRLHSRGRHTSLHHATYYCRLTRKRAKMQQTRLNTGQITWERIKIWRLNIETRYMFTQQALEVVPSRSWRRWLLKFEVKVHLATLNPEPLNAKLKH